jgi:hypothetical protein
MTKAQEIRELIAEQSTGPGERKVLETVADVLDESLTRDVPYRPEFRAHLRGQLMAEARRTLTPWYRRPAVWGSSIGVAAAAVVLAVGLQVYQKAPVRHPGPATPPVAQGPGPAESKGVPGTAPAPNPHMVGWEELPAIQVPDEVTPAGQPVPVPEPPTGLDLGPGLKVLRLAGQPDMVQFSRMAAGLGFTGQAQMSGGAFVIAAGGRRLVMTADGHVAYADQAPAQAAGPTLADASGALAVARRFLDAGSLPVPDLQPIVAQGTENGQRVYTVVYTPRVDGRPVVNARTVIAVAEGSRVLRADAYAYANEQPVGTLPAVQPEQALAAAAARGGARFGPEVDLVYLRTVEGQAVYLQPAWRVFGTPAGGGRVLRYVDALVRQ